MNVCLWLVQNKNELHALLLGNALCVPYFFEGIKYYI